MARGIDRRTGRVIDGWAYTLQSMETVARTPIGSRLMREYFGSLTAGTLVRRNVTVSAIERFAYGLTLMWDLWVPMVETLSWEHDATGRERQGEVGLIVTVAHRPNAHLGDYSLESNRRLRAAVASAGVRLLGL